jgi:DNA invertase Pin-like site-specific DNA recombinase
MNDKILSTHLERCATVYLRQSTLKQVHEHRESTARQYALQKHAVDLGWPEDRVNIIDEDLGQSGSSAQWRTGFQRLAEDVAHGRIGAIFALEVSRLARCSADWHRLLDLCGLADVVIVDEQAVYTPRDYNDRLLLGLKGTMSEAEQYWMRLRLQGGKLSKARRGELYFSPPSGYEWDEVTSRFRLDPDEQVQRTMRLVLERFRLDGSAYAVMRYFARQGLSVPVRDIGSRELRWVAPRHSLFLGILRNPIYAGAYVFGRREERMALVDGKLRRRRVTRLPQSAWKTCLRDHHPAYIGWEEFMANQQKLHENRTNLQSPDQRGAAREGHALLQGITICGKCGHRMSVRYQGPLGRTQYECRSITRHTGDGRVCWTVSGQPLDDAVAKLFLDALHPPEIELGLAVVRETERQAGEVDRHWKLRLERANYEARIAERRYKAVDPDNRVVARTLEREWNDKLREVDELQREHADLRRREKLVLSEEDRARVLALARDLPRVWNAATTTNAERKNLLRMLVSEVTLNPIDVPTRATNMRVLWQTGAVTDLTIARPDQLTACATNSEAIAVIRDRAADGRADADIATELNRRGLPTGKGRPWNEAAVRWVRSRHHLRRPHAQPPGVRAPDRRSDGLYSVHGIAARFRVTDHIVRYWMEKGWLRAVEGGPGRTWWFELDRETIRRLQAAKARGYGPGGRRHSETRMKEDRHYA